MTLMVLWTISTHGFTLITLSFPTNLLGTQWRYVECGALDRIYPWVIEITLLHQEKCPWNSVEMCRITLVVL